MITRNALEIIPVDIRKIRLGLGLTQKEMGRILAFYVHGPNCAPIPGSRINEWEMRVRAIPDYVYSATAKILVDVWSRVKSRQGDVEDPVFADLLNPALSLAISLEAELKRRRDKEGIRICVRTQLIRQEIQLHLESLLMFSMTKVLGETQL